MLDLVPADHSDDHRALAALIDRLRRALERATDCPRRIMLHDALLLARDLEQATALEERLLHLKPPGHQLRVAAAVTAIEAALIARFGPDYAPADAPARPRPCQKDRSP